MKTLKLNIGDVILVENMKVQCVLGSCGDCYFLTIGACTYGCVDEDRKQICFKKYDEKEDKMKKNRTDIDIPYHDVGDVFEYKGVKLEVVEAEPDDDCDSCYFGSVSDQCNETYCSAYNRQDDTDINYVEVKDEPMEQNDDEKEDKMKNEKELAFRNCIKTFKESKC